MTATDPQTPAPPVTPPRGSRLTLAAIILASVVLAAFLAATILLLTSGHHHQAGPPRVFPASTAPVTPASTASAAAMSSWCAGPGYAALQAVHGDLGQVAADARAGHLAAAMSDGTQLTADAEAAEKLPPPVTNAQKVSYVEAMGALSFAGIDLSTGNLPAADRAISAANGYLGQIQGILNCP